jgi:hypothetical protein
MSRTRRRVVATIRNGHADGDAPSLDLVRSVLAQRAPHGLEARALNWSSYFKIQHRQVSAMQVGRIFVAGDAAHIHSPFGGQGMNTGLQDAWNLAWKLDLAVHRRARPELLESYTAEREPVVRRVIETTHFMTQALGTPSRFAQALRDVVIPIVARLAPFRYRFVRRLSELGVDYHGSAMVEGPGQRYFDDSLRGGSGIGSRFVLLVDADDRSRTAAEARCLATDFGNVVELRVGAHHGITLVRPDGYAAYESLQGTPSAALQGIREVLERQVVSSS